MPTKKPEATGKKTRNAAATRQKIVQAAIAQFAEDGFAGASIDRIVDAVGLTKGAVYHHYKDKSQLFEAAFVAVEDRFADRLEAALRGTSDPRVRLATAIDQYLAACRDPEFVRVAVLEAPAALGWERWRELESGYFLGAFTDSLVALYGDEAANSGADTLVLGAASTAGLALSAVGSSRASSERQRLGRLVLEMADGLHP